MDYRQLRAFIAVFEERNITAAAQRIHLSQPALSGSIRLLETSLGTQLFVRRARGVDVTDDARTLYPQARRMVSDVEYLSQRFRQGRERQPLSIGVEQDVARKTAQQVIAAAHACMPALHLNLQAGCEGDARLASEDLRCEDELFLPMLTEPYVLAAPASGPLSNVAEWARGDRLEQAPWITCPTHASHQRIMPLYGPAANYPASQAGNFSLALALVAAGIGLAIVPESLAQETAGVVIEPLDAVDLKRRVGICYPAQSLDNASFTLLRNALQAG